jgi:hypothetical protein
MLRDATQAALFEILDRSRIPYEHNKAENTVMLKDTRSRILFRPVEEFDRLRGTNLAWFGLDELTYTQEEAWVVLEGRLRDPKAKRLCGFATWTPKGFDWVYRRFVQERVEGYEVIVAEPFENHYLLEQIPDFYERLKRSYDGKFYQQEVMGEYISLNAGLVYHAFSRTEHTADVIVEEALPLLWALDFNVDPMCSVVAQLAGETVRVLAEIVLSRATTQEACEEFAARFPRHRAGIWVYGDASGSHMQTTGTTDYQVIREFFRRGLPERDLQGAAGESAGERAGGTGEREATVCVGGDALSNRPEVRGTGQRPGTGDLQAGQHRTRQRQRPAADAPIGRLGVPDLAGVPAATARG